MTGHTAEQYLEHRERQVAALVEISRMALSSKDVQTLLDGIVVRVADALDNELCKVLKVLPGGKEVLLVAGVGWSGSLIGEARVPAGNDSQAGYTLATQGPVVVEDLRTETRFSGPALLTDHGVVSGMSVVIGPSTDPWGVLGAHSRRRKEFTLHDTYFLQSVANIVWDAIRRQESLQSLQESEQRFRTIADSAPVLIWVNDDSGCVFVNRPYLDFLGLSHRTDVRGYDWAAYVHEQDRDAYLQAYKDAMEVRGPFRARFRFRRHDGEYRWLQTVGVPRLDGSGNLLGYTGSSYDVHDEQIAATALRDADQRKDEFLAVLGHELRNPLAPLRTGVDLLPRVSGKPEMLESIGAMMERQLSHLVRLVDDLLDASRITQGRLELQTAALDLRAVVENAVEQTRPLMRQKGHETVVQMADKALPINGDFERLTQILVNLLTNAAKYSDPGGNITVHIGTDGEEAFIRIRDTGYGIPREQLSAIFEMFKQVPEHRARLGGGGLGIGLALTRQLVELHGGSIEARSDGAGLGSEFIVRLPLRPMIQKPKQSESRRTDSEAGTRRILIVDDNSDAAESLRMVLETHGHSVRAVYDGMAALDAAISFAPQVVLLDIGLPHMDGYAVARHLRSAASGSEMCLIAVTGWGQEKDKRQAARAGFDEHLTKPVDLETLRKLIAAVPARRQTTA